jgi:site-specific DNA recombinase
LRAAAYLRWSTREQGEGGYTEETQLEAIDRFCTSRGWDLAKIYEDAGVSGGSREKRVQLATLMNDAKSGTFDVVVCYKIDRMARNLLDLLEIIDELGKAGIGFASTDLPDIDPKNPFGRAMLQMIGAFAELERSLISARTVDAMAEAGSQGVHLGRIPTGFIIGPQGKLEPDEIGKKAMLLVRENPKIRPGDAAEQLGLDYYQARRLIGACLRIIEAR